MSVLDEVKRSFPPVADARTRLLVLGSLPGEESLARRQYYANPRNHFWRLIGAVTGARPRRPPLRGTARRPCSPPGSACGTRSARRPGAEASTAPSAATAPTTSPLSPPRLPELAGGRLQRRQVGLARPAAAGGAAGSRADPACRRAARPTPAPSRRSWPQWMKLRRTYPVTLNLFQGPVSSIAASSGWMLKQVQR